jgi:D-glycero-D-manno-heptose 1,7-bisphosphate phosphatase
MGEVRDEWTLFLDRDGVINRKLDQDYVKTLGEFEILDGVIEGLQICRNLFKRIIIVTNQRGVSLGLMNELDLQLIHEEMTKVFSVNGIKIDAIFYCDGINLNSDCRKPNPGMGLLAKQKFPDIDFKKSIMVGDSISDIEFGSNLNMVTVLLKSQSFGVDKKIAEHPNYNFESLFDFSLRSKNIINENS